ncbi:GLPGLI family protein [Chryseobacterium sp. GVT01B]|uniref:GLPGLI family protein n=1 Tax=Chryseobacterium sp. GVT01B TaxID=2862675 RepID=UPI001CC0A6AA|nr:GLPGLI family protein [Chryseobacterium sp. GVT01B]
MQKAFFIIIVLFFSKTYSQTEANRFFYELTYKKNKDSLTYEKILTILDITGDKSIYRDYLSVSQDSLINDILQKSKQSGNTPDLSKMLKIPVFSYKVIKKNPSKEIYFYDKILNDKFNYSEEAKLNWKIKTETSTINEYPVQKATVEFNGRKWTAWFSKTIPFQDGPYKFFGLPGLIVKIEDEKKEFSWVLAGNKKITNYEENSFSDKLGSKNIIEVDKRKFLTMFKDYQENPMGKLINKMTSDDMNKKMPDGRTVSEVIKAENKKVMNILKNNIYNIETNNKL